MNESWKLLTTGSLYSITIRHYPLIESWRLLTTGGFFNLSPSGTSDGACVPVPYAMFNSKAVLAFA